MYVSVGGRGTRGGVYRVTYKDEASGKRQLRGEKPEAPPTKAEKLSACLRSPQPLASWSRATWLPLAKQLGRDAIQTAAQEDNRPLAERLRAIEILAECFGAETAAREDEHRWLAAIRTPEVLARAAWLVGRRAPAQPPGGALVDVAKKGDPLTTRFALEALLGAAETADPEPIRAWLAEQFASDHPFVRRTASRVVARWTRQDLDDLELALPASSEKTNYLWMMLGYSGRRGFVETIPLQAGLHTLLDERRSPETKLLAARVAQIAAGGVGSSPRATAFDGYTGPADRAPVSVRFSPAERDRLASAFPIGERRADLELSRLLGMLRIASEGLAVRLLKQINDKSHPADDVHYLLVLASIGGNRTDDERRRTAQALLELDEKIADRKLATDTHWEPSISALYAELVRHDPELPSLVVKHATFGRAEHVVFTKNLSAELLPAAIAAFERGIRQDEAFPITTDLVFLLGKSPDAKHVDLVRRLHDDRLAVRGAALIVLAKRAEAADRARFVAGLDEAEPDVLAACLEALAKLPSSKEAKEQVALLRALRRLSGDEREYALRDKAAVLLRRAWNEDFGFVSGKSGHRPQPQAIAKWTDFVRDQFPAEFARQTTGGGSDETAVRAALTQTDWSGGDVDRGAKLFEARSCSRCHSGRTALGPDLAGATRRFSRDDLFTAIIEPSRDVSPRYQATMIQTADGKTYSGLVIYESVDGVTLRDGLNQTIRIDGTQIEARRKQAASFMPSGLLKDLKSQDLADLYAYLQSLGK
jgi:putative heme-binding domain-containing protein